MKTKMLVVSVLSASVAGIVAAAEPGNGQTIHLRDGTKLTFLGLTTGTRQIAPGFEKLATANWLYTPDQPTTAWIEADHEPGKLPTYELLISDTAKTACVNVEKSTASHVRDGVDIQGFILRAFPRWDKEFLARVKPYTGAISEEEFVITNPAPVAVAKWKSEPLPATRSDGDLEVTLTELAAGAPVPYRQGQRPLTNNPANQCVHLKFDFRQNAQLTTNWAPWPVLTSDAAGNRARGLIHEYPKNGINPIYPDRVHPSFPLVYDGYFYQPGLWPDQAPWKVRLEFVHRSNFSDEETVTFTNLAVRSGSQQDFDDEWTWDASNTNFGFVAEQMVSGVKLKLLPPLLYSPKIMPGEEHLGVLIYADPEPEARAMNLTLLQATDENGREVSTPFSNGGSWAGHFGLDFPHARDVRTLNLKLALHKSRLVEFIVNPMKH